MSEKITTTRTGRPVQALEKYEHVPGYKKGHKEEKGKMQSARHGVRTWEAKEGGGGTEGIRISATQAEGKEEKVTLKQLFEVL